MGAHCVRPWTTAGRPYCLPGYVGIITDSKPFVNKYLLLNDNFFLKNEKKRTRMTMSFRARRGGGK